MTKIPKILSAGLFASVVAGALALSGPAFAAPMTATWTGTFEGGYQQSGSITLQFTYDPTTFGAPTGLGGNVVYWDHWGSPNPYTSLFSSATASINGGTAISFSAPTGVYSESDIEFDDIPGDNFYQDYVFNYSTGDGIRAYIYGEAGIVSSLNPSQTLSATLNPTDAFGQIELDGTYSPFYLSTVTIAPATPTPAPGALALLGLGLFGIGGLRRKVKAA